MHAEQQVCERDETRDGATFKTITHVDTVHMLMKKFATLFGKGVIKSLKGEYHSPPVDALRQAFADVTLGDVEYDWTREMVPVTTI